MMKLQATDTSILLNFEGETLFLPHQEELTMPGHWSPTEEQLRQWEKTGILVTHEIPEPDSGALQTLVEPVQEEAAEPLQEEAAEPASEDETDL